MNTAIKYLLTALTALVAASCSGGDEPSRPSGDEPLRVGFILTLGDNGSRAPETPEGGYDKGSGYENYIDVPGKDFMFLFFDDNNKYVASIDVESVIPLESTTISKTYSVLGSCRGNLPDRPLKVVALANWGAGNYPGDLVAGKTTVDEVCEQTYDFTPAMMKLSADNTIPLYGIKEYASLKFDSNSFCDLGTLHLLRAYAKVEVYLSSETVKAGWKLEDVEMTRYNTKGYLAPKAYRQGDYVHNDYDLDYISTPRVPSTATVGDNLKFIEASEGSSFIAYVPEYRNIGTDATPTGIRVKVGGNEYDPDYEPDWVTIQLVKDGTTDPYDLLRNCWYRIEIYKNLDRVQVQVVPYGEVELEPDFGLQIGANLVPVTDENGQIQFYYDRETGKYYGTDKTTVINNPYDILNVDPVTGFVIIKDINGRSICLYDMKEGKYWVTRVGEVNTRVEIHNPFSEVVEEDDPTTPDVNEKGWLTFTAIGPDGEDLFICFYDSSTAKYYNSSKEEIPSPFTFNKSISTNP